MSPSTEPPAAKKNIDALMEQPLLTPMPCRSVQRLTRDVAQQSEKDVYEEVLQQHSAALHVACMSAP
jgi:hypothetical protein